MLKHQKMALVIFSIFSVRESEKTKTIDRVHGLKDAPTGIGDDNPMVPFRLHI
jgi:hypothetical protein